MKALLEKAYQERKEEEEKTLTLVSSRQHRIFKLATVWLSAVVALLLLPLIYLVFFQAPFKEKLLQADTAYLKVDYTGVIDELEGVAPSIFQWHRNMSWRRLFARLEFLRGPKEGHPQQCHAQVR